MPIDPSGKTVLVLGATGQQGGATAARLLARGWSVRALTRKPAGPPAQALRAAGAQVLAGNMLDPDVLRTATRGAYGVFSVQPTWVSAEVTPGIAPEDEVRSGTAVADIAAESGVRHIVYASSVGADPEHELPSLRAKGRIEQHIRATGVPATMLRPVSFMENYLGTSRAMRVSGGNLVTAVAPHVRELLIAVADIGDFAERAFSDPDRYVGEAFVIAGDRLTPPQIAARLSAASGLPIAYEQIPIETVRQANPRLARAFQTLNEQEFEVDIAALRQQHPGLLNFTDWLRGIGRERLAEGFAPAPAM